MTDYKKELFDNYVQYLWKDVHSFDRKEYDFYAGIAKKRFGKFLPAIKETKILDCACGAGYFLYFLNREGFTNVLGIDISEEQLKIAKRMGLNNVLLADMFEFLAMHKNEFELIIAFDIIEHLKKEKIIDFVKLIYEALKKGGKVIIATQNAGNPFFGNFYDDFTHEWLFTPLSLKQVLQSAGFSKNELFEEEPIAYDIRSFVRKTLWRVIKFAYKAIVMIERGSRRRKQAQESFFAARMFAVAQK